MEIHLRLWVQMETQTKNYKLKIYLVATKWIFYLIKIKHPLDGHQKDFLFGQGG
jgi:hypothetical protein